MSIFPNFLRSLLLTSVLSFAAPLLLVGGALVSLSLLSYVPLLEAIAQSSAEQILKFLTIFGSGCPLQGLLIIGFTCSFVGALFDSYTFYRYQNLRSH